MLGLLPRYYSDSKAVDSIINPEAAEAVSLRKAIYDVLDQFHIDTATWALSTWERLFGLTTDVTKTLEQRRAILKSRRRGLGTVTPQLIASVAAAFANGEVEVLEKPTDYRVEVTFTGTRGVPNDLEALKAAVRDVLPAHLDLAYFFTFLLWSELDAAGMSWNDMDDARYTWDTLSVAKPDTFVRSSIGLTFAEQ